MLFRSSKIVIDCLIHSNLLTLFKTSFKNFSRDSAVDAKKNIFRPIRVIDFFGTNQVHTLTSEVISHRMLN